MYPKSSGLFLLAIIFLLTLVGCTVASQPSNAHILAKDSSYYPISADNNSRVSTTHIEKFVDGQGDDEPELDEFDRPILSGEEITLDTEHFRIHYTLSGRDAAYSVAFVEEVALALEYSWNVEIDEFGWQAPPSDNGIGGDDRYDVYIQGLAKKSEYGHVSADIMSCSTDSSNGSRVSSYMAIDGKFTEFGSEGFAKLLETMRATVAHELNHSIQNSYDSTEPYGFLWEAVATWMEEEVYDDSNSPDEYNISVFKSTDTCQLAKGGTERVEDESHWYGEYLFIRYISEQYGHETIRLIWEYTPEFNNYDAVEAALSEKNTSLEETFRAFSLALLTRDFEEGDRYPTVRLEGQTNGESTFTPDDGVGQMAADYIEILAEEVVNVQLNADNLQGMLVGVKDLEATIFDMPANQVTIDTSNFDNIYLVVLNLNQAHREYRCEKSTYTIDVQPAAEPSSELNPQVLPGPNFLPLKVETLEDPDTYWVEGWDDDIVEIPADLIPYYLPSGYEFGNTLEITAQEYEEEIGVDPIWVIPGGGTATKINIWGPCDKYIVINVSDNPYTTMDGWYEEIGFSPTNDELFTIGDIDTAIFDYSDDTGSVLSANFIDEGKFFVVDGTLEMTEMAKVIKSLVDPLEPPDDYSKWAENWDQPISDFEAPGELLLSYIPSDYEYYETREISAEEYEAEYEIDTIWYIPGGGMATIITYFGSCDTCYLDFTVSESPYDNLDGWFDDSAYVPSDDELITINGIDVHVTDFSDDLGPFFSVTIIHNGKFIVVDGTLELDEITKIIENMFE